MRERIVERLREASRTSPIDAARWRDLRGRLGDIAISTIDAFCLSLLREFPLEADVDPGLRPGRRHRGAATGRRGARSGACASAAPSRETTRTWRWCLRSSASGGFARGWRRCSIGGSSRPRRLRRYLARGPRDLTADRACQDAPRAPGTRCSKACPAASRRSWRDGPVRQPGFAMLAADVSALGRGLERSWHARTRTARRFACCVDRLRGYFLTQQGEPRKAAFAGTGFTAGDCESAAAWKRHRERGARRSRPAVAEAIRAFRRDLNVVLSAGCLARSSPSR